MDSGKQMTNQPTLGHCPDCGRTLLRETLLISYRTEGGKPRMFAECSACDEPVHPR
jgi:hypothetical protein